MVLGDAGAGKTVAATYLVLGLIARRNQLHSDPERAAEPVPVRVNAAGWDGGQGFSAWLVARLGRDYRLRPNVAGKMVKAGMILPVLDGLDEMDDDTTGGARARALLDRLNQREWAHRPVVVLCRSNEFDRLKHAGGATSNTVATSVPTALPSGSMKSGKLLGSYGCCHAARSRRGGPPPATSPVPRRSTR